MRSVGSRPTGGRLGVSFNVSSVIPECAKRMSGIHRHKTRRDAQVERPVVMDSGLRPSAGPGMTDELFRRLLRRTGLRQIPIQDLLAVPVQHAVVLRDMVV